MDTPKIVRYHTKECVVHALIQRGSKWIHCVWLDGGSLKVRRVPSIERRYMTDYLYDKGAGILAFKDYATRKGASKRALAMINQVIEESSL